MNSSLTLNTYSICLVSSLLVQMCLCYLLILKVTSHGMGNSVNNFIEQWLTDRRPMVVVDGEVSSWKSVLSGVPQGSVLRPIWFWDAYDLEEGVTGNILKCADNTKLFRKTKEIGDKKYNMTLIN